MATTPPQESADSSMSVQAHQNQISSRSIMTTAPSRSISTAPTGIKSDVDSNSTYHITVNGAWHVQTLQHTENSNTAENRRSSSISPSGPSPWAVQGGESSPFSPYLEPRLAISSEAPPEIDGSETCVAMQSREPLPTPISTTLAGYSKCFDIVGRAVSNVYDDLRSQLKRTVRFKKLRRVRKLLGPDIKTQKDDYMTNNTSLIEALVNIQVTTDHGGSSALGTCQQIYSALCALWDQLHHVMSVLEAIASTDASQVSSRRSYTGPSSYPASTNTLYP